MRSDEPVSDRRRIFSRRGSGSDLEGPEGDSGKGRKSFPFREVGENLLNRRRVDDGDILREKDRNVSYRLGRTFLDGKPSPKEISDLSGPFFEPMAVLRQVPDSGENRPVGPIDPFDRTCELRIVLSERDLSFEGEVKKDGLSSVYQVRREDPHKNGEKRDPENGLPVHFLEQSGKYVSEGG